MPAKLTTEKKRSVRRMVQRTISAQSVQGDLSQISRKRLLSPKNILLATLIVSLGLFLYYKKDLFVAATVNGRPITTLGVLKRLNDSYKTQVLDQMINEEIILVEARKNRALPTSQEIKDEYAQLEKEYGGADALKQLLVSRGRDVQSLERDIKIQLSLEKLYSSEISVTDQEVSDYVKQYKSQLQAKDEVGQIAEATQLVRRQKLAGVITQKFQQLKEQAKVYIF